jgi:acetoin utilization protein AcuB
MIQKLSAVRKRTPTRNVTRAKPARAAISQMLIEDWMTKPAVTVRPRDSVAHARRLLEQHRINQLPVVMDRTLVGIVTDRDLRNASDTIAVSGRAARAPLSRTDIIPEKISVETVMSAKVMTLKPEDPVAQAANLMHRERIGGVPILDGKRLTGIITRSDVLKAFIALSGGKV